MSRYAATPLGQPGVYAAVASSGIPPIAQSSVNQVPGLLAEPSVTSAILYSGVRTIYKGVPTGFGIVQLQGSVRSMGFLDDGFKTVSMRSTWRNPLSFFFKGSRIRTAVGRAYVGNTIDDFARFETGLAGQKVTAQLLAREFDEVIDTVATKIASERLGGALGVGLGGFSALVFNMLMTMITLTSQDLKRGLEV